MAKKKENIVEELPPENISTEPLESVMGDRYATYAKYVIQDRAIPDVRDGLKPVQRRIIFSMYKSGNTINKPTKKCAHTVGAVMGTYHPHGDTSIYEALARMSQDWKMRYPLIDFQGNNGSIDGDSPAAYRYTESRLSELSNELVRDIEKETVNMQLNFDDTEFEPTVLPSRFPNLFVNGTEGIAVALATEIPPHNLNELVDAIIYRIGHKTATNEDLMQFVLGPDFPGGGVIYKGPGIASIYETGRGRIEMAAKAEIVTNKDSQQIVITELPYKAVKIQTVYEIDKIRHSKAIDGIIEVRDESDWKGIRIVVDIKRDAKADLILEYLMNKTSLRTNYSANMVAIVDGRPKTLTLLGYVDAYITHQVDVTTRACKFDLAKYQARLHIVEGLILASLNINEVVNIIKASKDKADSKVNLMARYGFSNEQAEAIVTMPLYKLSHTDEEILLKEKSSLEDSINYLNGLLSDENKLMRAIIKDLKAVANKYGNPRRTMIIDKIDNGPIDKRELISKEEVVISVSRDGYLKRSSIKSYKASNESLPGLKDGDIVIGVNNGFTTDYLLMFTNKGNYVVVPVHLINDSKWKDVGTHVNNFTTLGTGEKIVRGFIVSEFRHDLYYAIASKFGQIKRSPLDDIDTNKHSRPAKAMRIDSDDEIIGVELLSGNSDIVVISNNGNAAVFNENELTVVSSKAGGVKAMQGLKNNQTALGAIIAIEESEKTKCILFTDKGHQRTFDASKLLKGPRLAKTTAICPSFKSDIHNVVSAYKVGNVDPFKVNVYYSNNSFETKEYSKEDLWQQDAQYAKKNMDIPSKTKIVSVYLPFLNIIDKKTISHPIIEKVKVSPNEPEIVENIVEEEPKEKQAPEQMSIFDDLDE